MEITAKHSPLQSMNIKDAQYLWHPFTQMQTAKPLPIVSAKGAHLFSADGRRLFDATSSWFVNLHGHCHPQIADRIAKQAHLLEHVIFTEFTHENAINLAERLVRLSKISGGKVFYSDNGSTAIETALKMVIQYWYQSSTLQKRSKIICFENAYHGDTFGAMSASGTTNFNRPFWSYLFHVKAIPAPTHGREEQTIHLLQKLLETGDVACFIFEPILQGVGGMHKHSPEALDHLLQLCQKHQVITIADEVMTGFGRTGPLFACDYLSRRPDIMCLSKGLTGGFLPLGATVCSEFIFKAFLSESLEKAFLHGHSYCGNPIACAAALASLDLLEIPACQDQRRMIEQHHQRFCNKWRGHPRLSRCEVTGTILAIQFKEMGGQSTYFSSLRNRLIDHFLSHNIYIRPFGNVIFLFPPYCTTAEDLENAYSAIEITLENENEF